MSTPNTTDKTQSKTQRTTLETPLPPVPALTEYIDTHRIEYTPSKGGVTVNGSPFYCRFESAMRPQEIVDTITTTDKPWQLFGIPSKHGAEYFSITGTLIHVDNDNDTVTGSSKITLEVAPEWIRVYVKESAAAERVAEFVQTLSSELEIASVNFCEAKSPSSRSNAGSQATE